MSTSWTSVNLDLNAAFIITDQLSNITRGMSYPSVLFVAEIESFETRDVNFQELFSPVENLNSRELVRVSVGTSALPTPIPRKIYGGRCLELRTGMAAATSSNILVPSAHSIGESLSQVPRREVHMSRLAIFCH